MADQNDGEELITRLPTLEDLLFLCRNLNAAGAKYIVIGGWAVIQHELLLRLKQTLREKDAEDRFFLRRLLQEQENPGA